MTTTKPVTFGFLLLPGFPMSCLTSAIEPLRVANEIIERPVFDWKLLSEGGGPVRSSARVGFDADVALSDATGLDFLFVLGGPDSAFTNRSASHGRMRHLARHGTSLGAISGGVFPLARAGLLEGYTTSVHWCYRAAFCAEFPDIARSDDVIVLDRNRFTAAGAAAAFDLMLHLIGDHLSPDVATEVACWFQHPIIRSTGVQQRVPTLHADSTVDCVPEPVRRAIGLLNDHIEDTITIAEVAERMHLSQRQLERQFKSATGQSPSVYYRTLRMNAARQLVRFSTRPITDIAIEVGCANASQLSKHYRSIFGLSPFEDRRTSVAFRDNGVSLRQPVGLTTQRPYALRQ
ncbi:GlxA family transcriptional regulator [Nioella aestuarii]|uniref:GlxA family transcriptional regulator n=1 Tax=Nioella aestuarii TaxID=1662864 RepID=UPI003D7FB5DF